MLDKEHQGFEYLVCKGCEFCEAFSPSWPWVETQPQEGQVRDETLEPLKVRAGDRRSFPKDGSVPGMIAKHDHDTIRFSHCL